MSNCTRLFQTFGALIEPEESIQITDLNPKSVLESLREYGVLLFRGFDLSLDNFQLFTSRYTEKFVIHGAPVRTKVSNDGTVQTVTEGHDEIVLHPEMHFSPFSPDLIWFYCSVAPAQGGETTVCDGRDFFAKLSAESKKKLLENRLCYTNVWSPETWRVYFPVETHQEIVEKMRLLGARAYFENEDKLIFDFVAPSITVERDGVQIFLNSIAVHEQYYRNVQLFQKKDQVLRHKVVFESGEPIPKDLILEIEELSREMAIPVKWEPGDVLMINNRRVMHGRRAYDPSVKRSILVRMAMCPSLGEANR